MGGFASLDDALDRLAVRTDRARQSLYYCDVEFTRKSRDLLRQDVHASVYVLTAAAVEKFLNSLVEALIEELNARCLRCCDVALSLFSISKANELSALQDVRGLKMWDKRVDALSAAVSTQQIELSSAHIPLDGRTIRPNHLKVVWRVFGLAGLHIPDPRTGLALVTVADLRNLVAHGEEDTSVVAGMHSIDDTLKVLERIDDLAVHCHVAAEGYLNSNAYLR